MKGLAMFNKEMLKYGHQDGDYLVTTRTIRFWDWRSELNVFTVKAEDAFKLVETITECEEDYVVGICDPVNKPYSECEYSFEDAKAYIEHAHKREGHGVVRNLHYDIDGACSASDIMEF